MDQIDVEAVIERAAKQGARDALREIGLHDESAGEDIRELRDWLSNMRGFRRIFKETTAKVLSAGFWLILIGGVIAYIKDHMK